MSLGFLMIVLLLLGLLVGGIAVVVVIVLVRGKRQPAAQAAQVRTASAGVSPEERQAILKRLADGEISKQEAEEQISRLGTPVPSGMPAPPSGSGASKGCIIALIVGALLVPLVLFLLFALFGVCFFRKSSHTVHQVGRPVPAIREHIVYEEIVR